MSTPISQENAFRQGFLKPWLRTLSYLEAWILRRFARKKSRREYSRLENGEKVKGISTRRAYQHMYL